MGNDAAATRFVNSVSPFLAARDFVAAARLLRSRWRCENLIEFLSSPSSDVLTTATASLGLVGTMSHCETLIPMLANPDPRVWQAAENSLWRIWMQAGSARGNARLASAVARIKADELSTADQLLAELVDDEPSFAEAHHQRGIVTCLKEQLDQAAACYRRAVQLNPAHYAAEAGLGHVHAYRADVAGAVRHYRNALQIHPHLHEIREVVDAAEEAMRRRRPAAG